MPGNAAFWDVVANVLSQYPYLDEQGISTYSFIASSFATTELNITSLVDGHYGAYLLPVFHPSNSSDSLKAAITKLFADATAPYPSQFFKSITVQTYPDFWAWYSVNNGPNDAGHNQVLGSRLLDEEALTGNFTALKETYKAITPPGSISSVYLVGGKNVMNAVPRGGSNAVNPAWRKAYVHSRECFAKHLVKGQLLMESVIGVRWNPLDTAEKARQENLLTNTYVEALRQLAPDMGAYVNEVWVLNLVRFPRLLLISVKADPNEPNFQHAFWGENYPRLLGIKRKVDPTDVFWCTPCVGNERWRTFDDMLCKF